MVYILLAPGFEEMEALVPAIFFAISLTRSMDGLIPMI